MDSLGGGLCQQQEEVLTCTESENFQYNQWMTFSFKSNNNLRSECRVPVQYTICTTSEPRVSRCLVVSLQKQYLETAFPG